MIFSTSYYGLCYSQSIQKRIQELEILKKIFAELYGDVEYGACSLQESFFRIGDKQNHIYKRFLHEICKKMGHGCGTTVSDMFEMVIKDSLEKSSLNRNDLELLKAFASELGNHQKDSQLRMIKIYLHDLDQKISELERERISKQKLGRVLGISSGILIVILLL